MELLVDTLPIPLTSKNSTLFSNAGPGQSLAEQFRAKSKEETDALHGVAPIRPDRLRVVEGYG